MQIKQMSDFEGNFTIGEERFNEIKEVATEREREKVEKMEESKIEEELPF